MEVKAFSKGEDFQHHTYTRGRKRKAAFLQYYRHAIQQGLLTSAAFTLLQQHQKAFFSWTGSASLWDSQQSNYKLPKTAVQLSRAAVLAASNHNCGIRREQGSTEHGGAVSNQQARTAVSSTLLAFTADMSKGPSAISNGQKKRHQRPIHEADSITAQGTGPPLVSRGSADVPMSTCKATRTYKVFCGLGTKPCLQDSFSERMYVNRASYLQQLSIEMNCLLVPVPIKCSILSGETLSLIQKHGRQGGRGRGSCCLPYPLPQLYQR